MVSKVIEFKPLVPPALTTDANGATSIGEAYSLSVPTLATDALKVTAKDGSYFSWQPTELCYKDETGKIDYIVGSSPSSISIFKNQAKYIRTFPQADDIFNAEADRVKHWTILNEKPRDPATYLTGAIKFGVSGIINGTALSPGIHESISQGMFQLPKPVIKDLTGNEIEGYYEVVDTDNGQQLFLWFDAQFLNSAVYPVMIDPTVVVSSAYKTWNTAPPQILDNGWIVITMQSGGNIYFYLSKDNGATYTQLCFINSLITLMGVGVCSYGNMIYAAITYDSTYYVRFFKLDVTTVTNVDKYSTGSNIPTSLSSLGYGCSIDIKSDGSEIMVAWSDNTTAYPNISNIECSKTSDNGTTWTRKNVSNITTANVNAYNPHIIYDASNIPHIFYEWSSNGTVYPCLVNYNGTTWSGSINFINSGIATANRGLSYGLIKKFGANIGRIYAVCSTDSNEAVCLAYSDNFTTWTEIATALTTNSNAILAEKANGDILLMYNDATNVLYKTCANGTVTLSSAVTVAAGSIPTMSKAKNGMPMSIYAWKTASNVQSDKFVYNLPPNAPTILTRSNFDATQSAVFAWTFSDPDIGNTQSAYQLQIIRVSDGATVFDTGKVISTISSYTLSANAITNGTQYQWKVTTWDNSDVQGVWSSLATFITGSVPTVTITNPAIDGAVIGTSQATVSWNFNDGQGLAQSQYQVKLTDNNNVLLLDSGVIADINTRALTVNYVLNNNTSYKFKVTTWNSGGLASTEVVRTFSVSYTAPATPVLSHTDDNVRGAITLNISNPVPGGSQPTIDYNDVYRMASNENAWTRVATGIANNGTFTDYTPASGVSYQYKVTAMGSNGTSSDSNIISCSVIVLYTQLSLTADYSKYVTLMYYESRQISKQKQKASMQFAGREYPVSEFGEHSAIGVGLTFHINNIDDLNMLRTLVDSKQILLYRDNRGRRMFVTIDTLGETDENPNFYTVTINPEQVSYCEVV